MTELDRESPTFTFVAIFITTVSSRRGRDTHRRLKIRSNRNAADTRTQIRTSTFLTELDRKSPNFTFVAIFTTVPRRRRCSGRHAPSSGDSIQSKCRGHTAKTRRYRDGETMRHYRAQPPSIILYVRRAVGGVAGDADHVCARLAVIWRRRVLPVR